MKLRINGNSIRFRLGKSEVRRLVDEGAIEEITAFGSGLAQRFRYALIASDKPGVSASYTDQLIFVRVSQETLRQWSMTDEVSIHALQRTSEGELTILIEKDFGCLDVPLNEPQEDAFSRAQFGRADCTDSFAN
jgi:hypothetical protein